MRKILLVLIVAWLMLTIILFWPIASRGQAPTPQDPDTTISLKSDSTWMASRDPGFADWEYSIAPSRGLCAGEVGNFEGDPMWASHPKNHDKVYFRKTLSLSDVPKSAFLRVVMDDDGEVFINGQSVLKSTDGVVGFSEGEVGKYLRKGENTIELMVFDTYGVCQSAAVYLEVKIPFAEKYDLNIPLMKQSTLTWAPQQYAGGLLDKLGCGIAIGDCGCALSSIAMMLSFHGVIKGPDGFNTTPDVLNEYFSRNQVCDDVGCVSDGYAYGNVVWGAVHQYTKKAHERYGSSKVMFIGGGRYNKETVAADIKSDKPVILRTLGKSHWFVASGIDGPTLTIKDPLFDWSILDNTDYKNEASEMRRFTKVNSDFSAIEVFVKAPGHVLITAPDGKRLGYDASTTTIVSEISSGSYLEDDISIVVRHAIIQTPLKGDYEIQYFSTEEEVKPHYVVFRTNRAAESLKDTKKDIKTREKASFVYDPDFVLQEPTALVSPSISPTTLPSPTVILEKVVSCEACRGGENRTPTARTPCAHSTIILLPVLRNPFLMPACYNITRFDGGYNLRQSSLFFASDYFIIQ